jgi:hypothetical protein
MSVPRKNPYLTTRDLIVLGKIPIVLGKITNGGGKSARRRAQAPRSSSGIMTSESLFQL